MIKKPIRKNAPSAWIFAVKTLENYLRNPQKASALWDYRLKENPLIDSSLGKGLYVDGIRYLQTSKQFLKKWSKKTPSPKIQSFYSTIVGEIFSDHQWQKSEKIIHYGIQQSKGILSTPETSFLNALLRKTLLYCRQNGFDKEIQPDFDKALLPLRFSHPKWLVDHWLRELGKQKTTALLQWNQKHCHTYFRHLYPQDPLPPSYHYQKIVHPPHFYKLTHQGWASIQQLLDEKKIYIQDPSTYLATQIHSLRPTDKVLDLCAAPGGKSLALAQQLGEKGQLTSVDLPARTDLLHENLSQHPPCHHQIIGCDILELKLPEKSFDLVFLDAPCSNTGVIQRKPDVKNRLTLQQFQQITLLQEKLLERASRWVKPAGALIYSTCSIEKQENQSICQKFSQSKTGKSFHLSKTITQYPWETSYDGATATLLLRNKES